MNRGLRIAATVAGLWTSLSFSQIVIDHEAVAAFDAIPASYVTAAAQVRMMLRHASVGVTIGQALDCVQGTRTSPAQCTAFPDYQYDRRNWTFYLRGNPAFLDKVRDFEDSSRAKIDSFDVLMYKFCFIDYAGLIVMPGYWDSVRVSMERLTAQYPRKTFVWWTIPLTRTFGDAEGEALNDTIRAYCRSHGKILYDIADLESHDSSGAHITDPNGLEMAWQSWCGEQQVGQPSCHPNWDGSIRLAKAMWVLMARIAGWDGGTSEAVTFTPRRKDGKLDLYRRTFGQYTPAGRRILETRAAGAGPAIDIGRIMAQDGNR